MDTFIYDFIYIYRARLLLMTCTHMYHNHIHIITYIVRIHWWIMTCCKYDHIYARIMTYIVWDTPLMMTRVNTYCMCTLNCICNMDTLMYDSSSTCENIHAQIMTNIERDMPLMMTCVHTYLMYALLYKFDAYSCIVSHM